MHPLLKSIIFFTTLHICLCLAFATRLAAQYRFDSWTTDNGLPQNGVREITQTPDGYLWFTTFDGLVRFDGVKFTTFNKGNTPGIINNRFTGIYCGPDGTLYATTMEDGILTIYQNGQFRSLTSEQVPGHYIQRIQSDEKGEPRFLVEDNDRKSKTWYYLRNDNFIFSEKVVPENLKISYRGQSGKLWTIGAEKTIEHQSDKSIIYPYRLANFSYAKEAFEDSTGALWLSGNSLTRLKDGKAERLDTGQGFPVPSDYHSYWEEPDGSIWFANGGRLGPGAGLVRYKNGNLTKFGKEHGLSGPHVFRVLKDHEGTVWLATNHGLNRLQTKVIESFSVAHGLSNPEVYPIYRDSKGDVWIGITKGLTVFRNGKYEPIRLRPKNEDPTETPKWVDGKMPIQSFWEDKAGKIWIGVNGGIFIAENGTVELLEQSSSHHVHSIRQDRNGDVWAVSNKGALRYRDYKLIASYSSSDGLPNDFMTTVFEDSQGRLWFGGFGGLSEFKDGKFVNFTKEQGLAGNYVRTIYEDNEGVFWIGTYDEGLSRFKDGKFTTYNAETGLYNNGVFAIQEDNFGNFWISSNRGIYRVKKKELNDFAEGRIDKINSVGYGKEDGMFSTECNGGRQPSSMKDENGRIWFPTQDGVSIVNPSLENFTSSPPKVVIESASVERANAPLENGLQVEAGKRNIEFTYTGLSLKKAGQIKFKYKLTGHDPDWIDAGTRRNAYYSYLPPGDYEFQVMAASPDGVWSANPAVLRVSMTPFFYQTLWFYILCVFLLLLSSLAGYKIVINRVRNRERILTQMVAERTQELKEANETLRQLANSDGLTRVGNRRLFEEFLAGEWHRAIRFRTEVSLILLDIDHFKLYNDTYGHQAGDECLKKVAEALLATIKRPTDLLARFGGEEFAIILGGTDAPGAMTIATQAIENIRELQIPHSRSETGEFIAVSAGIATTFPQTGLTEAHLIKAADKALYRAKQNGRNQINAFDLSHELAENPDVLDDIFISVS
jgi:diguanylate cyclase (GGDEF)-like protein